ncbi:MAG: PAS domain S-box protein [Candidatus Methanofastidiosa archaeon]|nr:PAS domain S-box protein [Candidatus Methanofastidiosa archaeon]
MPPRDSSAKGLIILYVDDEDGFRDLTKCYLERSGDVRVDTASSAAEALSLLRACTYDAVVSDYQMPTTDGIALLRAIRASGSSIPFVLFTGKGREDVVVRAFECGADYYLQKGGDPRSQFTELIHKVRQAVGLHEAQQALETSEERYRRLFEESPLGILNYDAHGNILACNSMFVEIIGSSREALVGLNIITDLTDGDLIREVKRSLTSGEGYYEGFYASVTGKKTTPVRAIFKGIRGTDGSYHGGLALVEDVTEHAEARDALMSLATEYETVFHGTQDALFLVAVDESGFRYLRNNRAHQEQTGFPLSEIEGKTPHELVGGRVGDVIAANYRRCVESRESTSYKEVLTLPAGEKIWKTTLTPVVHEGTVRYIVGSSQDVTEHERLVQELSRTTDEQQLLLDNIGIQIWYLTDDHTYGAVNEAHAAFYGLKKHAVAYRDMHTLVPPHVSSFFLRSNERVFSSGAQERFEAWATNAAGQPRLLAVVMTPMRRVDGTVSYVVCTAEDITEYRRAEEQVSESEDKYRSLVENLNEVVFTLNESAVITYVSPTIQVVGGYAVSDVVGTCFLEYVHPDEREGLFAQFSKVLAGVKVASEYRVRTKGGTPIWIRASAHPILRNGLTIGVQGILYDISDYKRVEEALRTSETTFRNVISSIQDMVFTLDCEQRHTGVYGQWLARWGRTEDHFIGKTAREIWGDEQARVHEQANIRALEGEYVTYEWSIEACGTTEYYLTSLSPLLDEIGSVRGIVGIGRLITERKRAEQALRENEARYRTLFEDSLDAIWATSAEGRIIEANPAALELLGYAHHEFIGIEARRLYATPSDRDVFVSTVDERGFVKDFEVLLRRKDGREILCSFTAHAWYADNGTIRGYRGIVRNITERRRMEEALRESEEKYRLITEHTGDEIIVLDLSLRVVYASPSIEKIRGFTPDEVQGMAIQDLLTQDSRKEVQELFSEHLALEASGMADPDRSVTLELEEYHKDGSIIAVEVTLSFLRDASASPKGIIAVSRDITERKRAEVALRSATKKLDILSGITRHDVNNRLTALIGSLELSLDSVHEGAVHGYLKKALREAGAIREQIAFTRTYEGVGGMDPSWQDVGALLTSLSLPEGTAPPASCVGVEVYADPMLRQVFATLLDNTLRHAGTASPRVTVTCTHTKDGLAIAWEDDGVGVPENEKERIFERGYGKNTGLGLFLAREILAITGIAIREEGSPGAGARFVITVPPGVYRTFEGDG